MAKQNIGTGETFAVRDPKLNANFTELYDKIEGFDDRFTNLFFYRSYTPVIDGSVIRFLAGTKVYFVKQNNSYSSYLFSEDTEFTWSHNSIIVYDIDSNVISHQVYNTVLTTTQFILAKNIDGKFVGGYLKAQYEADQEIVIPDKNLSEYAIRNVLQENAVSSSYASDICSVGNEIWTFAASNDANSDTALCQRYSIDANNVATKVGEFTHNLGHCNSIEYNAATDCLIVGNGSGDYDQSGKFYILKNASTFNALSSITIATHALVFDLASLNWGAKMNVVWGEDNNGRNDIAYVVTDDNKNIRKIQLGKGINDLGLGSIITVGATEFNGTFKLLKEYSQTDGSDVNQGSYFDDNGSLLVGLGHNALWYDKLQLLSDGSIKKTTYKQLMYDEVGVQRSIIHEGITRHKGVLFVLTAESGVGVGLSAISG